MAMIPRYLLQGLGVTACNSGDGVISHHSHIVTSEYDPETKTFGTLGTVMSITAQGYKDFIESEAADPYAEARAAEFAGASRICAYAGSKYPLQIAALLGFSSDRPIFDFGWYTAAGAASLWTTPTWMTVPPETVSHFYITTVYYPDSETITFFISTSSTFGAAGNNWPAAIMSIPKTTADGTGETVDWIGANVIAAPYDAGLSYLAGLPSAVLEPDSTGETGIIIGAEAHYVSGSGDEITEEIVDISDQATYEIINSAGWLDENRQLIIAEWATNVGIVVTWDGMPGEVAQIAVVVGGWDNDTGDDSDDTGGGSGGDTGDGGDTGGGTGGDDSGGDGTGGDDGGGSGDDTGDDATGTASVEALREAFMQGMATMAAMYSRLVQRLIVACLSNGNKLPPMPSRDVAKYPHAYITTHKYSSGSVQWHLTFTDGVLKYKHYTNVFTSRMDGPFVYCCYILTDGKWVFDTEETPIETGDYIRLRTPVWASVDVNNYDDGTLYLAASEPVPVYE